jgi:hypothetical protein
MKSVRNHFGRFCALVVGLLALAVPVAGAALPNLAQLKIAAESGDPVAEFEYANRIALTNQAERLNLIRKSAGQGYGPAQAALAEYLTSQLIFDARARKANGREAARWASRAAYQGLPGAQRRLSEFYFDGTAVSPDPVKAYMWAQIAVLASGGDHENIGGLMYRAHRDVLIARLPSDAITEGQRLAAAFVPTTFPGLNPVEADLIFAELKLLALYDQNGVTSAVVNNVRFKFGETNIVSVDGQTVALTCRAIEAKTARFVLAGTRYETILMLKR